MFGVISKLFGKNDVNSSQKIAHDRLKFVLVHDRAAVSPEVMESLKNDIIKVISNYMEINQQNMEITLEENENCYALGVNVPVHSISHAGKRRM